MGIGLSAPRLSAPNVILTNTVLGPGFSRLLILNPDPDQPLISSQLPFPWLTSNRFPYGYDVGPD